MYIGTGEPTLIQLLETTHDAAMRLKASTIYKMHKMKICIPTIPYRVISVYITN